MMHRMMHKIANRLAMTMAAIDNANAATNFNTYNN